MGETTAKKMESKLEECKVFDCNLPNEIWCEIFMYLDKKSLKNVTATCKLWFGIIRGNEKFSGHVKMKFIDLKDLSKTITEATQYCVHGGLQQIKGSLAEKTATDSEWLRERWPSMRVLEVSLGNQFQVARHQKLLYQMTKFLKLKPTAPQKRKKIGFSCRNPFTSSSLTMMVRYRSRFFVPKNAAWKIVLQDD